MRFYCLLSSENHSIARYLFSYCTWLLFHPDLRLSMPLTRICCLRQLFSGCFDQSRNELDGSACQGRMSRAALCDGLFCWHEYHCACTIEMAVILSRLWRWWWGLCVACGDLCLSFWIIRYDYVNSVRLAYFVHWDCFAWSMNCQVDKTSSNSSSKPRDGELFVIFLT